MNLYDKLNNSEEFIDFFCDILEEIISIKVGYNINVGFKKNENNIFFFIDGSSILQVMPDKDLQYTYANSPSYQEEIKECVKRIEKQFNREEKINQIIKKES